MVSKHSTSRFLTACRRLEKNSLTSIFDIPDDVKLAQLSNSSFEFKNVTFQGLKTYSDPSYIFSEGQDLHCRVVFVGKVFSEENETEWL